VSAAAQHVADPDAVVGGAECALGEEDDRPAVALLDDAAAYPLRPAPRGLRDGGFPGIAAAALHE
jgi:hypothetical protein